MILHSDRNVRINRSTKIGANTYIGKYSTIGLKTTMGESVVVHANVKLSRKANIKPNGIVLETPTSFDLFKICAVEVTENEYEQQSL